MQKPLIIAALLLLVAASPSVSAQPMTAAEAFALPQPEPDGIIAYGTEPRQFGELRMPAGEGPFGIAVIVHGGCWLAAYDQGYMGALAEAVTDLGWATWTIGYRRVGETGGGWPNTFLDAAAAIDYLPELARRYPLDIERVITLGHSAGGHLALWLAGRARLAEASPLYSSRPQPVDGVLALAAAADLEYLSEQQTCGNAATLLMDGGPTDRPDRYAEGSLMRLVPLGVPQILVTGELDETWTAPSDRYYAAAAAAGDAIEKRIVPDAGHFELVVPDSENWQIVRSAFADLATRTGQAAERTPAELGDLAAERIREAQWAEDRAERSALIEEAIGLLEVVMNHPRADSAAVRRSRFDRVVALRVLGTRESMQEAVSAWEALVDDGLEPPVYVAVAAADAYMYLREPERAEDLYRKVLERRPERIETYQALFWALLEQEKFDAALETIDRLVEHPDVAAGSPRERGARVTAAMGRGYANRLAEAMQRLEAVVAAYREDKGEPDPGNQAAIRSLATIYRWRGWSRRALKLMRPLLEATPDHRDNRLLHAGLLRDLGRYDEAGDIFAALQLEHPENRHVQRASADWHRRERWSISIHGEYGESDGVQEFGSRDRAIQTRLSAPWIGSFLQPYVKSEYSDATFPEGEADYDRVAIGIDYRRGAHDINLEFHRNRQGGDDDGVTAAWDVRIDDHWSLATRYESFSTDVPLRARGQGLDGWKAEAAVRWQAHESLGLRLGVSRLDISDGNQRDSVLASLEHRLHVSAHHTTDGRLDLYGSRASQTGGPYFNPEEDASLTWVAQHDWITWRRYERSFTQRFVAGGGGYWQKNFETHAMALARYEHMWQLGDSWFVHYGVGAASRVFDGNRETRVDSQVWLRGVF